jgi:branched-chain amino acid transport system ATP-binding protein
MPVLECSDVSKYFGGLVAVSRVSFQVNRGEIMGLIGPNGAGKTTLFNLISGALAPSSGMIRFRGENITGLKPHQITRRGVARTFQSVKVFSNMTVMDNVLVGSIFGGAARVPGAEAATEAARLLELVGLSRVHSIPARDLTLAHQKRLGVARALATRPEIILLDEMMAGLNHTEVLEAMKLVTGIRDTGITIIMIEHVMKAIMGVCDRIVVLHHGEKIAEGTPQEIASSETVVEIYLGE